MLRQIRQHPIVFRMRANEEPGDGVVTTYANRPVRISYTHAPQRQRRMQRLVIAAPDAMDRSEIADTHLVPAVESRWAISRNRDERICADARSQLIRLEWLTFALIDGREYIADQPLQLARIRRGGLLPTLVLFYFVQHQSRQRILTIFRHLSQSFDGVI
jgi:hypothetical protein